LVKTRNRARSVGVRDHRELEFVLLLPGPAGLLCLHRADVDDLKAVAGEALIEFSNGRRLLPTTQSSRFPEDEQQPVLAAHG
jgi:hypothetical protein